MNAEKLGLILMRKKVCPGNLAVQFAKELLEEMEKDEKKEIEKLINEPDAVEDKVDKLIEVTLANKEVLDSILKVMKLGQKKGKGK